MITKLSFRLRPSWCQPTVAVVDEVVDDRGTRDVATEYLNYLYSDEAQRIEAKNFYRPSIRIF